MDTSSLPMGAAPPPVPFPHFPDRLHAYVWRNWPLVPLDRLAEVVAGTPEQLLEIARSLGLGEQPPIGDDQLRRTYFTIIRRNWHLLPYEQIISLLGWTVGQMEFVLREGDGLFWWMGGYKPKVAPLVYERPAAEASAQAAQMAALMRRTFPHGFDRPAEPLFAFIEELSTPPAGRIGPAENAFSPLYCHSYFGTFRDALSPDQDCYPDGYLARLAAAGVDGIWLHEPLYKLAPFPWDEAVSAGWRENLARLAELVERGFQQGIGIYLYLNEPRPMPVAFFDRHPELRGVGDAGVLPGQVATLCTSVPAVQDYLRSSMATLCQGAPGLAGVFTITASESYTNCWSHHDAADCPRCSKRRPEEVIAEVNCLLAEGIEQAGSGCRLICYDWGWRDEWVEGIIARLPLSAAILSVSEWSMPIERGGVAGAVGEYSLSVVGPGPRASRHWELARERGLGTIAKVQASTTWELGSVPYLPVVENITRHAANLRAAGVDGLMLSWTLGGYPSPGFEAVVEMGRPEQPTVEEAMVAVAERRFGPAAGAVVRAWQACSAAFQEYPFACGSLYQSPVHLGPANLLWGEPTGYHGSAAMGFAWPFDDAQAWSAHYPPAVFGGQMATVAAGFERALARLARETTALSLEPPAAAALARELGVMEAAAIHFRSVANQVQFVLARDELRQTTDRDRAEPLLAELDHLLRSEASLAARLLALQSADSRLGFEAACQYLYLGVDLAEKVANCHHLLTEWLPRERAKSRS